MLVRFCTQPFRRSVAFRPRLFRACGSSAELSDEALARQELGKRAYREVQVARRRKREAEDEVVLYRSACAAGFAGESSESDDAQRRQAIDRFMSSSAEALMDIIAAKKSLSDAGVDFTLEVAPSCELPQPIAGDGVFVKESICGEVPAGTVLAFYPGSVYMPHEVRWLGGYGPTLARAGQHTSSHVIGRMGGIRIDGLWSGIEVPASEYMLEGAALEDAVVRSDATDEAAQEAARSDAAAFCSGLTDTHRKLGAAVPIPEHAGKQDSIRRLNPLAVGEMINHPPAGRSANVVGWPVDLNFSGKDGVDSDMYLRAAPNAYAVRPEGAPPPGAPCPYTVVLVAAEAIRPGDELFLDYGCELLPVEDIPLWFVPASLRGDALEKDIKANPALAIRDELHAWRDSFEKKHGRKPTRHDMVADPLATDLFSTFQKYRKLGDL